MRNAPDTNIHKQSMLTPQRRGPLAAQTLMNITWVTMRNKTAVCKTWSPTIRESAYLDIAGASTIDMSSVHCPTPALW